eukprot:120578-Alexandrium_andersonii.AAC.1
MLCDEPHSPLVVRSLQEREDVHQRVSCKHQHAVPRPRRATMVNPESKGVSDPASRNVSLIMTSMGAHSTCRRRDSNSALRD